MQHHGPDDPYEREPLDADRAYHQTPPSRRPMPPPHGYTQPASPYHDSSPPLPPQYQEESVPYGRQQLYNSHQQQHDYSAPPQDSPYESSSSSSRGPYRVPAQSSAYAGQDYGSQDYPDRSPVPPRHGNNSYYSGGGVAPSMPQDNHYGSGQLPPPPSRTHYPNDSYGAAPSQAGPSSHGGNHAYDPQGYGQGHGTIGRDSYSNLAAIGASRSGSRSPSHFGSEYDNPFNTPRGYGHGPQLGEVNPNDIIDDGDDGLVYHRPSNRNSMLSSHNSDRARGAGAAGAAAAGGAAAGGLMTRSGNHDSTYDLGREKPSDWMAERAAKKKKWKWVIIGVALFVIIGAIVGGVVGGLVVNGSERGSDSGGGQGQSAEEDVAENGDLGKNSAEIKKLMNNPGLHKVFPGMDYTPLNTQYPDCIHDPPSQNNVTRDVAVLSQLTNKIRLYGTDCNQTQMLVHAIERLELQDEVKIWMGVWQDNNETTNARQLEQMWDILDEYGEKPFEGIIVANEILFRKEMTITQLATILDDVRTNLSNKNIDLPVATSDLGDDWTSELASDSDYLMANIHPFFAGVDAKEAAAWTYSFWQNQNSQFFKSDKKKNIIAEVGWPTGGGTNCGGATSCTGGSVAGVEGLNQLLEDWVCPAIKNGTEYFWFSAFDEPWKERFNEKGKAWEDKWGLMDVDRNIKDGVKIPDCGGTTI